MKIRLTIAVITCKRCKVSHNNPLTHRCVTTMADLGVPANLRKARDAKRAAAAKRQAKKK